MVTLSVTVDSEMARQGLEDLSKEIPIIGRRRIFFLINRITRRMEAYPPERPFQRYVRTGRLGFSWHVKALDKGYQIYNTARSNRGRSYGKYVVGSAYGTNQAWMHKGRWPLLRDVAEEEAKKEPKAIADEIVMVARRKGFDAK